MYCKYTFLYVSLFLCVVFYLGSLDSAAGHLVTLRIKLFYDKNLTFKSYKLYYFVSELTYCRNLECVFFPV